MAYMYVDAICLGKASAIAACIVKTYTDTDPPRRRWVRVELPPRAMLITSLPDLYASCITYHGTQMYMHASHIYLDIPSIPTDGR